LLQLKGPPSQGGLTTQAKRGIDRGLYSAPKDAKLAFAADQIVPVHAVRRPPQAKAPPFDLHTHGFGCASIVFDEDRQLLFVNPVGNQ